MITATGGAAAVSGARFARMPDLPFTALIPGTPRPDVVARIVPSAARGG